jgi:ribonuclease-3
MPNPTSLAPLERALGVSFRDKDLLAQALTHRSFLTGKGGRNHNERLEFLGDAVLEFVATEYLFYASGKPEGDLTNFRSALVNGENLARIARELGVGDFLYLSRGEDAGGGREKASTLANALEAIIGALYLDQGFEAARVFVQTYILTHLQSLLERGMHRDPKSRLQEIAQEKLGITPTYETLGEEGPDHQKVFTVSVLLGSEHVARGKGPTKQRAELNAAEKALKEKGWQ